MNQFAASLQQRRGIYEAPTGTSCQVVDAFPDSTMINLLEQSMFRLYEHNRYSSLLLMCSWLWYYISNTVRYKKILKRLLEWAVLLFSLSQDNVSPTL